MPDEGRMVDSGEIRKVGKQIVLPWSKAAEIAAKSMKTRFGRSVVTTASIVLAIAFLMSILTGTTVTASLKAEPVRRVVALREREARARNGEDIGLRFPANLESEPVRAKIRGLDKEVKATVDPTEKRELQARLAVAELELKALNERTASKAEALRAKWPELQAHAETVAAENDWTRLVRRLHDEGYTDVELVITTAPPRRSFLSTVTYQMDPRDKWLAVLASLVCFVGIWNAMLMSVHERFREIGTMKCLGALESFIVKLYFLESAFIGLVGTLGGIVIGLLLSIIRSMTAYGFSTVLDNFDYGGAALSAVGTLFIGALLSVGAAIFPARSAAQMDPIVAMRVDE